MKNMVCKRIQGAVGGDSGISGAALGAARPPESGRRPRRQGGLREYGRQ